MTESRGTIMEVATTGLTPHEIAALSQFFARWVEDDGPGIPGSDEDVASLFSIARPLTSSKLVRLPTRGALGNGLRVVAGAVLGSGGTLRVSTRGRSLCLVPQDSGITTSKRIGSWARLGTRVE